MIFVLKAAFHFGSFIYRSVSGMRPLPSANNGSDNSKQFSFTLKFWSHCSIFVYFSNVFTFFLCLFIFSIREYTCNVSQTYLRKNDCCIIFYCIFTLGNDVFLRPPRPPAGVLCAFGTFFFCFAKNWCTHFFCIIPWNIWLSLILDVLLFKVFTKFVYTKELYLIYFNS